MKQVFVAGTSFVTPQAAGSNQRFSTLASGEVGIWGNQEDSGEGDFFASALIASTMAEADTSGAVAGTTLGQAVLLKPEFQLVQGMPAGSNPIASPIINASQVHTIEYIPATAAVLAKSVIAGSGKTPAIGEELTMKFIISDGDVSVYDAQINGAAPSNGVGLYPNKVIPFSYTCASATLDTEGAAIAAAINSHGQLKKLVSAAWDASADTLTVTALSYGSTVSIKNLRMVSGDFLGTVDTNLTSALVTDTGATIGSGNYHQVLSEEKQARYSQGNFNRMYFPDDYTSYVDSATAYDQVRIVYRNSLSSNVLHGGNAGLNEIVFYWKDTAAGSTVWDTVFKFTADTAAKFFINS